MLRAALVFLVMALISYLLGATGMAGFSFDIARILLLCFLVLATVGLTVNLLTHSHPKDIL